MARDTDTGKKTGGNVTSADPASQEEWGKEQSKRFPPFGAPRFTQIPDVLFDEYLPGLGLAELKVLLAIMRRTYGWRKPTDAISLSQLQKATGLSRKAVWTATNSLEEEGYIIVDRSTAPNGGTAINLYRLNMETDTLATAPSSLELMDEGSQNPQVKSPRG